MSRIDFKRRKNRPKPHVEKGITFSSKIIPKEGIMAISVGILSIMIFIGLSIFSTYKRGEGPIIIGVIGMMAFFLAISGFVMSLRTMKKDDVFIKIPIYGVIINTLAVILYLILYFYGIILMMI